MKKKIVCVVAALIIGVVTVLNVKTVLDANRSYDLAMTSIDALSENGNGESGDQESNNNGSGKFYYEHLKGRPDDCKLFRHVNANGNIAYTTDGKGFEVGWTTTQIIGVMELCPHSGGGCTVYSCQTTN